MPETKKHRSEIDGLRAIAVLAVVFYHARLGAAGGFVGVDVFFVISGFLITGIITRSIENNSFSLFDFWERRIRRIFPALFVTVSATLIFGCYVLLPNELVHLAKSAIAQALLLANVFFWNEHHGYFSVKAEFKPLLHTWSLALEEQFYLLFPLLLVFLRNQSRKRVFWILAATTGVSFAGGVYLLPIFEGTTFFLLPTRAWELLVGSLLAIAPWQIKSRPRFDQSLGLAGLIAILVPVFLYDSQTPFPGLAAVPPVLGTVAILHATAATPRTITQRLLSMRPLTFVGLISYSMYLWHWPILVFIRLDSEEMGLKQIAIALFLTSVAAVLSWRFIEQPFRRHSLLENRRHLFGAAIAMTAVTILGCAMVLSTSGLPNRFSSDVQILISDITRRGIEFETPLDTDLRLDTIPTLGIDEPRNRDERLDFVLWGDSHGMLFCRSIDEVAFELQLSGKSIVTSSVLAMPNVCMPLNRKVAAVETFDEVKRTLNAMMSASSHERTSRARKTLQRQEQVMKLLAANRPRNLILICRWAYYIDGYSELEGGPDSSHLLSDDARNLSVSDSPEGVLARNLQFLTAFCEENDIHLWIVKQVPEINERQPARDLFLWSVGRRADLPNSRSTWEQHRTRQARVDEAFRSVSSPMLHFVDPSPFLFDENGYTINHLQERSIYRDDNHLTVWGLEQLEGPITDMLRKMKRSYEGS